jgi:serine palmitoyltransferase
MTEEVHGVSEEVKPNVLVSFLTYYVYMVLIVFGHIRDFFGSFFGRSRYLDQLPKKGIAPLLNSWENFFTRRLYHRIQDCWNRPIASAPGTHIKVMERVSDDGNKTLRTTGKVIDCINLGSYNYLGFADDWQEVCGEDVLGALEDFPISNCSARTNSGTTSIHRELEQTVARFLDKDDAVVFTMGYGVNGTVLPALLGPGSLVISDSLNHTSIVNGCRDSGADIKVFRHNDTKQLEKIIRESIMYGQKRREGAPYTKILVAIEGIYSMEGEICRLPAIVSVCKKYNCYIYLDEAHSIGALGKTGRGVCEYTGVSTSEIDVLMGTFTKSFGGMGGYIAASQEIIDHLRANCQGLTSTNSLSPVVAKQVLRAFQVIMGEDGTDIGKQKLASLNRNANYFRRECEKAGFHVIGDYDSPVIVLFIYHPCKIGTMSRFSLEKGIACVVVGFPATPLLLARTRVCVSAGHTKEDMDIALEKMKEAADIVGIRYNKRLLG